MRACSICNTVRSEDEYNYRNKKEGIKLTACRYCTRRQVRAHYIQNREYYLAKAQKRNKRLRVAVREYVWSYLELHPCIDCGETDPVVLEFDHISEKTIAVSHMNQIGADIDKVQMEIDKCVVRCANCHRRKTSVQFGWYRK